MATLMQELRIGRQHMVAFANGVKRGVVHVNRTVIAILVYEWCQRQTKHHNHAQLTIAIADRRTCVPMVPMIAML
jgi:hypothetical protein